MKIKKVHLEYLCVFIGVLGMGSLYFQVLRMPIMAAMLLGAAFMMGYYNNFQLTKSNFNLYVGLTIALVLTSIVNYKNGFRVNDLVILLSNIIYVVMLQDFISFRKFTKIYTQIMLLEAAISLICFIWGDVLGKSIPLMHLEFNGLNGFYLTPFYTLGWANIPVFGRNAGMFNEPGSHQIFLNFALLFLLCDDDNFDMKPPKYRAAILLLIVTIFTTLSTTGFICLGVVLLTMSLKKQENDRNTKLKLVAMVLLAVLFVVESQTGVIETKIAGRDSGGSFYTRYNDTLGGFTGAFQKPIAGIGYFAANKTEALQQYGIVNISNGLASFAMNAGVILTVIILILMIKNISEKFPYGICFTIGAFVFYLLCVNSEGVFMNLLFLSMLGEWKTGGVWLYNEIRKILDRAFAIFSYKEKWVMA